MKQIRRHIRSSHPQRNKCQKCYKRFDTTEELQTHLLDCNPGTCSLCKKTIPTKRGLQIHNKVVHNLKVEKSFDCTEENCGKSYGSFDGLRVHLSKHKGVPLYECKICQQRFWSRQQLRRHSDKIHVDGGKGTAFVCEICNKSYACNEALTQHNFLYHRTDGKRKELKNDTNGTSIPNIDKSEVVCEQCGKTFSGSNTNTRLLLHIANFHNRQTNNFSCNVCDTVFTRTAQLDVHLFEVHKIGTGDNDKPMPEADQSECICEQCGKSFSGNKTNIRLLMHMANFHNRKANNYSCHVCDTVFTRKAQLDFHLFKVHQIGDGEKYKQRRKADQSERVCEQCGKTFIGRANLVQHISNVHPVTKQFCEVCGKGFNTNAHLRFHLFRVHKVGNGEKYKPIRQADYSCRVIGCRKKFWGAKAKENLKTHIMTGHGSDGQLKQFVCQYCGKGFSIHYKFRQHVSIHVNKDTKPFTCNICGKGFSNSGNLRYHELNTHKAKRKFERKKETKPRAYIRESENCTEAESSNQEMDA